MRIGCPNCDALYEVDDNAIPPGGRDVQCSNCGHGWFQRHPEAEAEAAAEAEVFGSPLPAPPPIAPPPIDPPPAPEPSPPAEAEPEPLAASEPAAEAPSGETEAVAAPTAPPRRALDESLLAVLREEAAREIEARRRDEARLLETQPDLGLPEAGPRRAEPAAEPAGTPGAGTMPPGTGERSQRRDLLPDIEEINSTLRPGAEERGEAAAAEAAEQQARKSGFRSGFVTIVAVFAVLVLLYVLAPRLASAVPALTGALDAYVGAVDGLRIWLDGLMQSATGAVRGVSGQGG